MLKVIEPCVVCIYIQVRDHGYSGFLFEINRSDPNSVLTGKVNNCIFDLNTGRQTRIFAIPVPVRCLP